MVSGDSWESSLARGTFGIRSVALWPNVPALSRSAVLLSLLLRRQLCVLHRVWVLYVQRECPPSQETVSAVHVSDIGSGQGSPGRFAATSPLPHPERPPRPLLPCLSTTHPCGAPERHPFQSQPPYHCRSPSLAAGLWGRG